MTYVKQSWADGEEGGTPITAAKLAHIEQGVEDAHSAILTLAPLGHTHTSAQITDATELATPSTVVKRDAAGRFAAVDGAAASDVVTKGQLDGKASTAVQIVAGTGLTGGGDLSADVDLAVAYGSGPGTAVQGNDARVTADQAAVTASIRTLGSGALQAAAGNHGHVATAITDSTATGRSLLTAADVAAVKALLAYAGLEVSFAGTGLASTNVSDAIEEVFGYADDAGDYWSATALTLSATAGTYTTDSDLSVPIAANEAMWLDYYFTFSGPTSASANLRAQLTAPTGATAEWGSALDYDAAGSGGTAKGNLSVLGDTKTFKLNTGATGVHIRARVVNGATAGTVAIKLSPDTTTASALTREAWPRVAYSKAS